MSHILDIQPHHPHYPPASSPDSQPSPSASHYPGQTGAAALPNWLAPWFVEDVLLEEGVRGGWAERERKRGQGFFFLQAANWLTSQMSGGVGSVVGLKHPLTLFLSPYKHNAPLQRSTGGKDCAHACTLPCTATCGLPVCFFHRHTPLFKQNCLHVSQWNQEWDLFTFQNKSWGLTMTASASGKH